MIMSYIINNYSEDYLEQQYEIGNSVLSKLTGAVQTSIDDLKQIDARKDFDPEMKFYAFKVDEMIGQEP